MENNTYTPQKLPPLKNSLSETIPWKIFSPPQRFFGLHSLSTYKKELNSKFLTLLSFCNHEVKVWMRKGKSPSYSE
jgi:hypothetical protein